MSNLKKLREDWEMGLELLTLIPDDETCFFAVLQSVREDRRTEYNLHRYFKIGESWQISVDKRSYDPQLIFNDFANHRWRTPIPEE